MDIINGKVGGLTIDTINDISRSNSNPLKKYVLAVFINKLLGEIVSVPSLINIADYKILYSLLEARRGKERRCVGLPPET